MHTDSRTFRLRSTAIMVALMPCSKGLRTGMNRMYTAATASPAAPMTSMTVPADKTMMVTPATAMPCSTRTSQCGPPGPPGPPNCWPFRTTYRCTWRSYRARLESARRNTAVEGAEENVAPRVARGSSRGGLVRTRPAALLCEQRANNLRGTARGKTPVPDIDADGTRGTTAECTDCAHTGRRREPRFGTARRHISAACEQATKP